MNKKSLFFALILCASAMLMTSCQKEGVQRFKLNIVEQGSKTSLGDSYTTWWQSGDQVYINSDTEILTITSSNETYTWAQTGDEHRIEAPYGWFYSFYGGHASLSSFNITEGSGSIYYSMPASYTYNPNNLHSPMAAACADGNDLTLNFYNLCSLLELEVPIASTSNPVTITITETTSGNVPLSGNFCATSSESATTWTTSYVDNGGNTLTITKTTPETKIYIPIPSGQHMLNIHVNSVCFANQKELYTYQRGMYYRISTMPTPDIIPFPYGPADNPYFFGKGNMTFHANETPQWRLEANQWDYTIYAPSRNSSTPDSSSLLNWMPDTLINPAVLNNGGSLHGSLNPLGYAKLIETDRARLDNWTIPTRDQWTSILGTGSGDTPKWAYVKIMQGTTLKAYGMLIVPNTSITLPTDVTLGQTYNSTSYATGAAMWNGVPSMTTTQFEDLEKQGCLFLPAYGFAEHKGNSGTYTNDYTGYYRTADYDTGGNTWILKFSPTTTPSYSSEQCGTGAAVRLIYIPDQVSSSNN